MHDFTLPTTDGRSLLLRGCVDDDAIQFGIIGKRGGMVEAVAVSSADVPGLLGYVEAATTELEARAERREAAVHDSLLDRLAEAERRANRTHCERGHELTRENSFRQGKGKGCRTCRREGNVWWRKRNGLA